MSSVSSSSSTAREAPWRVGLRGLRANLLPGLALQVVAVTLVLAYYFHAPTHALLERLSAFRTETGLVYALISTPFFGGLLPFLVLHFSPRTRAQYPWSALLFLLGYWVVKGAEVQWLYRSLAATFGHEPTLGTIIPKVVCDQFLYNPLWAAPTSVLAFAWKDAGFRWAPVWADLRTRGWFSHKVFPLLLSTWGVWIPAVTLIYSLPTSLQIPLFNVVLCFWTLLMSYVVSAPPPPVRR